MHMGIEWNMLLLILINLLLGLQVVSQMLLARKVGKALAKMERYVKYIMEDEDETSKHINIEETPSKGMDERQKELLLQEMLDGFLA